MNLQKTKQVIAENWNVFKKKELYLHTKEYGKGESKDFMNELTALVESENITYSIELCTQDWALCNGDSHLLDFFVRSGNFTQVKIFTHHKVKSNKYTSPSSKAIENFGTNK